MDLRVDRINGHAGSYFVRPRNPVDNLTNCWRAWAYRQQERTVWLKSPIWPQVENGCAGETESLLKVSYSISGFRFEQLGSLLDVMR